MTQKYYKILNADGFSPTTKFDYNPYLPKNGTAGKWLPEISERVLHASGYHLTKYWNMWYEKGARIYEAEFKGKTEPITFGVEEKITCAQIRLLRDITEEALQTLNKEEFSPESWNIGKNNTGVRNIGSNNSGNYNRSNNLELAAKAINGTVLMPGETFSYNQTVGERTISAGYKAAAAYAGGKVIQDVGGGICQISSTLYNAVLLANLEITDRSNHCFETSYVPAGRDATVNWGTVDFQFKNNRKYPIKIETTAGGGIATAKIHGLKEENEYEVVIQSKVTSYISRTTRYKNDSTMDEGKEVIEDNGFDGCNSETYKILKLNGEVVSQALISRDSYDPMDRIIIRGTKKVVKPEQEVPVNKGNEEQEPTQEQNQTENQEENNNKPNT